MALPERIGGFNEAAPRWARKPIQDFDVRIEYERSRRFNEAAPRWARKPADPLRQEPSQPRASMRPRHDGRGNASRRPPLRVPGNASMRPRHDGRGNNFSTPGIALPSSASMRPRHDGRGNRTRRAARHILSTCFNEAAPRWARKQALIDLFAAMPSELQ